MKYEEAEARKLAMMQEKGGKPGLRGKIDAKCIECIYDPYSPGNWRKQVQECTDMACPLYSVRSVSSA